MPQLLLTPLVVLIDIHFEVMRTLAAARNDYSETSIKGQMNQKIEIFSFVALPAPNTKKNTLSEIWVKIFHTKPLKKD